jgi:adenosylcobinamide-GDP ribazoletransferase
MLKRFILMIQFFTSIPIPVNMNVTEKDFGKGLIFAPIVGLIIGGILAWANYLLGLIFPTLLVSVFTVIIYILLTGGLHLDGLGDTFDGIFSNRPKERILEIMRDSRVGTNAVLAVVCLLLVNVAVIASFDKERVFEILLLMPVAGRIGSLVGAGVSAYARSGQGLGKSFIDYCGIKEILIGVILISPVFFVLYHLKGIIPVLFVIATAVLLVRFLGKKIGGATGDILGAVCELNQSIFLVLIYLLNSL